MPELIWNPTEFLGYLEVEPSIGEYEEEYGELPDVDCADGFHWGLRSRVKRFC